VPSAGTYGASVTFTPTDTANYDTVVGSVNVAVAKGTPSVTAWPTASGITYGQALSASTLSGGTVSTTGSFAFTVPATVPSAGTYGASVTFTPTDTANYDSVVGAVNVAVAKANPNVTSWPTASVILVGQTLASSTLSGGMATPTGNFTFTFPGTTPGAGTNPQSVTFTPNNTADYNTAIGSVDVTVNANPVITATAGANGSISPAGATSVTSGGSQSYTITRNAGYRIVDVKVDNVSVGPVSSYTFSNVTANHTIDATFTLIVNPTITSSIEAGSIGLGTITPLGTKTVAYNGYMGYRITPITGYHVADVKVDRGSGPVSVGPVTTYTVTNITTTTTITASFEVNP
jgi:hypothetical protein